jgi:FAD/FMN-containing dehydrogenase
MPERSSQDDAGSGEIMKIASANSCSSLPAGPSGRRRPGQRGCHDLFYDDEPILGSIPQPVCGGRAGRDYLEPEGIDKFNLFYPPDPGSATVATMGGAVMMNAGGMRGVKYGVTRDYLLGMEIVLPSGAVMNTGGVNAKDVTGYDLTRLLCGSEGTLALATKIIVRLLSKPKTKRTLQAIYNRIDDAGNTVAKIVEAGIIPATLEDK